jgi:hypothetical protein
MTELAYILDRSGSMESMKEASIAGFNHFLSEQLEVPGDARLTLVLFDEEYVVPAQGAPLKEVEKLTAVTYVPRGTTALLDAIGRTVKDLGNRIKQLPAGEKPSRVIVAVFTDGLENASHVYTSRHIADLIKLHREELNWEFLFLGANQDAIATAANMNVGVHTSSNVVFTHEAIVAAKRALSRKVRAMRMRESGSQDAQAVADEAASMADLVKDEEGKPGS